METVEIINWSSARAEEIEDLGFSRPDPEERPRYHGTYTITIDQMWDNIVSKIYANGFNVQVQRRITLVKGRVTTIHLVLVDKGYFRIK